MNQIRHGLLAILAFLALSYDVGSQSGLFKKRVVIKNCYKSVNGFYLASCSPIIIWSPINCANKSAALQNLVHNLSDYSNYSTQNVICNGGNVICCIQFTSASASDTCAVATEKKLGDGNIRDENNTLIPNLAAVKLNAIECKN